MSCCGDKGKKTDGRKLDVPSGNEHFIKPDELCVMCGEKHLATAYALSQEPGYVPVNRQRIIGELVACQWHIYKVDPALAEEVRNIRHLIQNRNEADVDWHPLLTAMDALATAATLEDTTTTTKKEA